MNDNRFREPLDKRYRDKLGELEALADEAREAQAQVSLITARIAGVVAELATLGQISTEAPIPLVSPTKPDGHDGVPCTDRIWSEIGGGSSGMGITGVTAR